MTYKETLDFIKENKLDVLRFDVAIECDWAFDFKYTNEDFEKLCGFVSEIYLKTNNIEVAKIAYTINRLINYENKTITEVLAMGKWEFIDKIAF